MVDFFDKDDQGVEGGNPVVNATKKSVNAVGSQTKKQADVTTKAIVAQFYATTTDQQQNNDAGNSDKTADLTSQLHLRPNPQNQMQQQIQNVIKQTKPDGTPYTPEEAKKLVELRKILHEEQTNSLFHPKSKQRQEQEEQERVALKLEQEKKAEEQKKQEKQAEEHKKHEVPLAVKIEQGKTENKGWGAG